MSFEQRGGPIACPPEWQLAPLGTITTKIGSGATPTGGQAAYQAQRSNFALVRSQNVFDREFSCSGLAFISDVQAAGLKGVVLQADDILLNITGDGITFGRTCLVPSSILPACVNQHVAIIRLDRRRAHPGYVLGYLTHPLVKEYVESFNAGGSRRAITKAHIESFVVPLPPMLTQVALAKLFAAFDDRITLLRETNATLEAIAQALFKSWFVDFDPVHAKRQGRLPEGMDEATAALFPDAMEETALGLVPKGWDIKAMADVSTVGIGKTPPRKEQHWFSESPSDVRWVSIRDMGGVGVYATETSECLTPEAVERFNVRRVPDNTVLLSFKMTIGRVNISRGELTTNEAIAHFRLDPGSPLTSEFIYLHLKQFDFSKLSSTSSIADAVNSKTVREIPILVPSPEVLAAFQHQVGVMFAALKNGELHAQSIAQIRDSLLPRLISGQLSLPEAESALAAA
ncbi:restriction endonuclease subunit S [Paucibacter sp. KBW04]|uniref:restriction endonuclease subunit S n=1 Tax=Paucibacter sp. KBW04 TaxID=2153361 RepID=UPI000F55FB2F|nr:restriction endonuclease subunit S [Paucibacter sp. KBW04]RQO59362.1 restriction endonuclease subunit S [Paucibacter sp. KBW04]